MSMPRIACMTAPKSRTSPMAKRSQRSGEEGCFAVFFKEFPVLLGSLGQHHCSAAGRDLERAAVALVPLAQRRVRAFGFPSHPVQGDLGACVDDRYLLLLRVAAPPARPHRRGGRQTVPEIAPQTQPKTAAVAQAPQILAGWPSYVATSAAS